MTKVNVYLTFDGNCREAFEKYASVFGAEPSSLNTFGEMPQEDSGTTLSEELKNRIMHITLPIGGDTAIMGSDTLPGMSPELSYGNNFSISVDPNNVEEGRKILDELAEGGTITVPYEDTFWGAYFGMCIDKFGVAWMVNCTVEE